MKPMNRPRLFLWAGCTLLWCLFSFWYTNTGGPLSASEIEHYLELASADEGTAVRERLRQFLETDTGDQFIMLNILHLAEHPPAVPGAAAGSSARDLLDHYMEYMYPALLARASHPVYAGTAISPAMDIDGIEGIEGAEFWSTGALMRYRSRRDLLEIAMNPSFAQRHVFKLAALEKTIALPVENVFYYADPRLLLALILITLASVLDRLLWRPPTAAQQGTPA